MNSDPPIMQQNVKCHRGKLVNNSSEEGIPELEDKTG